MLVPTTVLAQQHWNTFRERYRDFPVRVEMVSRFRRPADVKQVLADFARGQGRGADRDAPRALARRDPEGARARDRRRGAAVRRRAEGAAAPAAARGRRARAVARPRSRARCTCRSSGLRDISVIETPPEGRRPIRTYVGEIRRRADQAGARARGRARGARRSTSTTASRRSRRPPRSCGSSVPGLRFLVAHGQMRERELEDQMLTFLAGDADVLVSTTIIESGLDIPQANTLIVERADTLGLAPALPDPRARRPQRRPRARVPLLSGRDRADPGGARAARDARRPHRARRRLRDRDARPRDPRRRRPARRRAVRPRRGARVRALRRDAARGGRRALRAAAAAPRGRCASTRASTRTFRPATSRPRRSRSTSTAGSR